MRTPNSGSAGTEREVRRFSAKPRKTMLDKGSTTNEELIQAAQQLKIPLRAIRFKDQLKELRPKFGAYIINMANSDDHSGGTHWIALLLGKQNGHARGCYFDSFGLPAPVELREFAKEFNINDLICSNVQIQSINSGWCGEYCIDWLNEMTHGHGSFEDKFEKYIHKYSPVRLWANDSC